MFKFLQFLLIFNQQCLFRLVFIKVYYSKFLFSFYFNLFIITSYQKIEFKDEENKLTWDKRIVSWINIKCYIILIL